MEIKNIKEYLNLGYPNINKGNKNTKYIEISNLRNIGLSNLDGYYLKVSSDLHSYKIKTNYPKKKKLHISKEVFNLIIGMINELQ